MCVTWFRIASASFLAAASLGLAGCIIEPAAKPPASGAAGTTIACDTSFTPPAGFTQQALEHTEPQGAGIRIDYANRAGDHIFFTAGPLGDFFEQRPAAEGFALRNGHSGYLFDYGKTSWVLLWYEPDSCHQYSVATRGLDRAEFLKRLVQSHVLNPVVARGLGA